MVHEWCNLQKVVVYCGIIKRQTNNNMKTLKSHQLKRLQKIAVTLSESQKDRRLFFRIKQLTFKFGL
jgi:hypothetical protein